MSRTRMSAGVLILILDVAIPLAVFYGARAAGANQWLALILAAIAPAIGIALTWIRRRRLDPIAVLVIVSMVLSLLIAFITADPRALLARDSWFTAITGLWILGSLATRQPFLEDIAEKISPPKAAERYAELWATNQLYRRWLILASVAWGAAFLIDAVLRVIFAYTLPVDSVPGLSVAVLVVMLAITQGSIMLYGRHKGITALLKPPARAPEQKTG